MKKCNCCGILHEDYSKLTFIGTQKFPSIDRELQLYNCICDSTLSIEGKLFDDLKESVEDMGRDLKGEDGART